MIFVFDFKTIIIISRVFLKYFTLLKIHVFMCKIININIVIEKRITYIDIRMVRFTYFKLLPIYETLIISCKRGLKC